MKRAVVAISIFGVAGLWYPAFAAGADVISLRAQVAELMRQALAVREQVKKMAFENPAQAQLVSVGQKQVALQVGHWKLEDAPWELRHLDPHRQASGGGYAEWEINLRIAEETKQMVEKEGIGVTLLPAILPSTYKADVFVAIHADQNPNLPKASGFKVVASAFDRSGKAKRLAELLAQEYRFATWLEQETYIPNSMPYYYAFNHEKFIYAVHPTTPAVIIETGYLPNPRDRAVILSNPHMPARGIAGAIVKFLKSE